MVPFEKMALTFILPSRLWSRQYVHVKVSALDVHDENRKSHWKNYLDLHMIIKVVVKVKLMVTTCKPEKNPKYFVFGISPQSSVLTSYSRVFSFLEHPVFVRNMI